MKFNVFKRRGKDSIKLTAINLYWKGAMHSLGGMEAEHVFSVSIPFSNKVDNSLSFLKKQERKPESVESVEAGKPFKVLEVDPALPLEIPVGESISISIKIEGPEFGYSGPLTLKFGTNMPQRVHIELPEIFIKRGERRERVNEHGEVYNLVKGQVFEVSAQMYRLLTFDDSVERVSVSSAFEFVGCSPKLPFKINDKSSYVVAFMIKAPDFDYSGPLEIEV